ncbi:Alkaline phosphatase [hydrothermal vent metagenome]|uniref:Alkaline phosphatase n=1 Tax=hydrothermal vent metagenome TaxID=652676 RepID=A0A1W1E6H5_9ZZZZ
MGYFSAPTLADIDGDGDLDLVVGEEGGKLFYYKNTDTTVKHTNPTYINQTGGSNPFKDIDVGDLSKLTLADIDGDGDLDLVIGESYGTLHYYKNTDTTAGHTSPTYTVQTGGNNPFKGVNVGIFAAPTLADINSDGNLDLVIGASSGALRYYYNQFFSVDTQAPTVDNITRNADSNLLIVNFNESLNPAAPDKSAFTVTGKTIISTAISDNVLTLTLDSLATTDVITFSYTKPSSGNTLKNTLGNETPNLINYHIGGSAADTITGSNAADIITGNGGDDILTGGDGDDTLSGGEGGDTLKGGDGDDILMGGKGNDWVQGNEGNDTLIGGEGDDWLLGGEGNDILTGGSGTNTYEGGAGNDIFDFDNVNGSPLFGQETINDFVIGEDKIDLRGVFGSVAGNITAENLDRYIFAIDNNSKQTLLFINIQGDHKMEGLLEALDYADMRVHVYSTTSTSSNVTAEFNNGNLGEYILG